MALTRLGFADVARRHGERWNEWVHAASADILGLDITSTCEWISALHDVHLNGQAAYCIANFDDGAASGVQPVYESVGVSNLVRCRRLSAIGELYSSRSGFVTASPGAFAHALFEYLQAHQGEWDQFIFPVAVDSPSELAFRTAAQERAMDLRVLVEKESPYIVFQGAWDDFFAALPKKFRWFLRSSRKKLEQIGEVRHVEYRDEATASAFIEAVEIVERASWKEQSGTSITQNARQQSFYHQFLPIAGEKGWLSGHVF